MRSLLISPMILSTPINPLVVNACFSCSRSSLWTDLDLHRHLPPSSTSCLMTTLPKGKICSPLLWCDQGNISGKFRSDLARLEHFRCSAHDVQSLEAMKTLLAYSQNMFPPPSILSILCLRGHLSEASQHSLSITPPKSAIQISRQCSVLPSKLRFVQLEVNNPVKLSLVDRFIQTSSREGRERSFHTSSSSKERSPLRPNSLYSRDDPFPVSKTGKSYSFPNRLLSYRMVHLGPVDTTTSITMIVEVLEHVSKSRVTVAILKFRRLEGRSNFFMIVFACGTFVNTFNVISSSVKLVSLSIYRCVGLMLVLVVCMVHRGLSDNSSIIVISYLLN